MVFGRKKAAMEPAGASSPETDHNTLETEKAINSAPSKAQIKRASRTRWIFSLLTSFLLLIAVVFLILVQVGNTSASDRVRNRTYFIKLDLTNIVPQSITNAVLVNSIARSLGLHDFYQVGLWSYCQGFNDQGVTDCSDPVRFYWFNPVEIIISQLLAGATIALPTDVTDILDIIRLASRFMFGFFTTGLVLAFVMIFLAPLSVLSRWAALFTSILTFIAALLIAVATGIATAMFVIMRNALTSVAELNIGASLGVQMFAFMYVATAASILAAIIQMGECCCCASRRDVRTGRKMGSKKAWTGGVGEGREEVKEPSSSGKKTRRPGWFGSSVKR